MITLREDPVLCPHCGKPHYYFGTKADAERNIKVHGFRMHIHLEEGGCKATFYETRKGTVKEEPERNT